MSEAKNAQIRALIEEQLGELRHFSGLPAAEIEAMALRISRAINDHIEVCCEECMSRRQNAA